jgi:hypothetical protein
MSYFLWHVIADMSANTLGILDEEKTDMTTPRMAWCYQMRTPAFSVDQYGFFSGWTFSKGLGGDPTVQMWIFGQDGSDRYQFEPYMDVFGGTYRPNFIHGVCVDGSGSPLAAATLELFLTATDVFVSRVTTDSNGIYSLPTGFTGQNHYIVANYGPNTLVGASVNTLQPVTSPW